MNRRKFITQSSLLASAAFLPGSLMLFTKWEEEKDNEIFDTIIIGSR